MPAAAARPPAAPSATKIAVALAAAGAASAQTSKLVWRQNEQYAVYTSSGVSSRTAEKIRPTLFPLPGVQHPRNPYPPSAPAQLSRHKGTTPTFSTATWLNAPIMVEVFNVSDNGGNIWAYASTSTGLPTFQVDMARHADSFGVGNIDTIAAEAQFVPPSTCQVFAWSSLATSSTPAWFVNVTDCDANLLYDDDRNVDISDDGSVAAFSGFLIQGKNYIPQLWVFDAQTGKVRFTKNLGVGGAGGPVQLSENGTWVAWSTGDSVMILNGLTGAVRDTIQMGWNCPAVLSDSGDYVAFAGDDVGKIYTWDAANNQYTLKYAPVPSGGGDWYATTAAISSDGSGAAEAELVTFGYITQTALGARVIIYSMVTGAVLTDCEGIMPRRPRRPPSFGAP